MIKSASSHPTTSKHQTVRRTHREMQRGADAATIDLVKDDSDGCTSECSSYDSEDCSSHSSDLSRIDFLGVDGMWYIDPDVIHVAADEKQQTENLPASRSSGNKDPLLAESPAGHRVPPSPPAHAEQARASSAGPRGRPSRQGRARMDEAKADAHRKPPVQARREKTASSSSGPEASRSWMMEVVTAKALANPHLPTRGPRVVTTADVAWWEAQKRQANASECGRSARGSGKDSASPEQAEEIMRMQKKVARLRTTLKAKDGSLKQAQARYQQLQEQVQGLRARAAKRRRGDFP